MKRELLFSLIITFFLVIGTVSAQAPNRLGCTLQDTPCSGTLELMRLSAQTNAHGEISGGSYPYVICCGDSQGGSIQELEWSCIESSHGTWITDEALRLSASTNAHAQVTGIYPIRICLSVHDNPAVTVVDCISATDNCPAGYTTVVSLSATSNAHLAKPTGTGSYSTKICCKVEMDDTPPTGLIVGYLDGFYNGISDYTVDVSPGTDPETGIVSAKLFMRTASLDGSGGCQGWGGWSSYGSQSPGTTSVDVAVTTGTCYMFNYSSTNGAQLTSYVTNISELKVDRVDPVTSDNYAGGTHGGAVDVQITCEDPSGSGCDETFYCIYEEGETPCGPINNVPLSGVVEVTCGTEICHKIIRYYSTDNAGNTENIKETDIIHIDTNLPWCRFTAPDPQSGQYINKSMIELVWEGGDPGGAGIKSYEILNRTDGSSWGSLTGKVTYTSYQREFVSNHQYDFRCIVINNEDETGESGILSLFVDSTSPISSVTSPAWTGENNLTVQWTGDDFGGSGISGFFIHNNMGSGWSLWDNYTTAGSAEYEFQGSDDMVIFRVYAVDRALNTGDWSGESTTRLDKTPPICIMSSLDTYQAHNTFPVDWTGSDSWEGTGSSLDFGGNLYYTVEYSTDQTTWIAFPDASKTEDTTKPITGTDSFTYHFRCKAEDAAGNEGSWSSIKSTTVDSSPPDITDLRYNKSVAKDEENNISVTVSDIAGIESVALTIDNNEITPSVENKDGNEWELVWHFMAFNIGTKTAKITATDTNGNLKETIFNFTISACVDGQIRECDPRDPATGTAYSEGVCKHTGIRTCAYGMWSECTGGTLPSAEDCNGLDDDCDGDTDESGSGGLLTKICGTDAGICSAGLMTCAGGSWSSCAGESGPNPEGEVCGNGLDDDCDGVSDEDCDCDEGETQPCGVSSVGACRFGIQTCENGKMSTICEENIDPVTELCGNGLDDDCDGDTDCDDSDCVSDSACANLPGTPEPFPIGNILMLLGVIVMGVLLFLWYYFKKSGQKLTWETLKQKWGSGQ